MAKDTFSFEEASAPATFSFEEAIAAKPSKPNTELSQGDAMGGGASEIMDAGAPVIKSAMNGRTAEMGGNFDPMLKPEFVANFRTELGKMPLENRLNALKAYADSDGVYGRAAKVILADEDYKNRDYGNKDSDRAMARALNAEPKVVAQRGTKPPVAQDIAFPESTPNFIERADGVTPKQVAETNVTAQKMDSARADSRMDDAGRDAAHEEQLRKVRASFAEDNPILSSVNSGLAGHLLGAANAIPTAADFFNKSFVNPVLNLFGAKSLDNAPLAYGTEELQKLQSDYLPKIAKLEFGDVVGTEQFFPWMATKVAANSPSLAMSVASAFVPPLRAMVLPTMGATTAGQNYADGDDSRIALAKGALEVGTEMIPYKMFDRISSALKAVPKSASSVLEEAGKRIMLAGTAMTLDTLTNAVEEVISQVGGNLLDKHAAGKDVAWDKGAAEAGIIGAATGHVMSAPHVARALAGNSQDLANDPAASLAYELENNNFQPQDANLATVNPNLTREPVAPKVTISEVVNAPTLDAAIANASAVANSSNGTIGDAIEEASAPIAVPEPSNPFTGIRPLDKTVQDKLALDDDLLKSINDVQNPAPRTDAEIVTSPVEAPTDAASHDPAAAGLPAAGSSALETDGLKAEAPISNPTFTHTQNEAGNVSVSGDVGAIRAAFPGLKGFTFFADGKPGGVTFSVSDSPAVLEKLNAQPNPEIASPKEADVVTPPKTLAPATGQPTTERGVERQVERASRIETTLANGGHVVGDDLRMSNGMSQMKLTSEELATIPDDKIRSKPNPELAKTDQPAAAPVAESQAPDENKVGRKDSAQLAHPMPITDLADAKQGLGDASPTEHWDTLDASARTEALKRTGMATPGGDITPAGRKLLEKKWATIPVSTRAKITQSLADIQAERAAHDPEHLGVDSTPLREGGKPFQSKKSADSARKQQPMMRTVRVAGGYAITPKTEKQIAAQERAAKRLRHPNAGNAGVPTAAHEFIASEGMLHPSTRADMGIDGNPRIGNRYLFASIKSGGGLTMEKATERLLEDGYLKEGDSHEEARKLIKRSLSDPQYNHWGTETMAEREMQAREAAYHAEQEAIALAQEAEDNNWAEFASSFEGAILDMPEAETQSNMSREDAFLVMGFTEQEYKDAIADEPTGQESHSETDTGISQAPARDGTPDHQGRDGTPGTDSRSGSEDDNAEFEHAGLKIYPINIRIGDKVERRWGVQTLRNAEREKSGERQIGGDPLALTPDEAKKLAESEVASAKVLQEHKEALAKSEQAKAEKEAAENSDFEASLVGKFIAASGYNALRAGGAKRALHKPIGYKGETVKTSEFIEELSTDGYEPATRMENRVKEKSSREWNRMDNRQQAEHERKVREGGKVDVYSMDKDESSYTIGKTEYDFAKYVQSTQAQAQGLTAPTRADILAQQERTDQTEKAKAKADADAEKKAKAEREAEEIKARQDASAENFQLGQNAEDSLSGQGSMFDAPAAQATDILNAANVTGKERIDVLKDVKAGTITPEELQAAYPAKDEAKPAKIGDFGEKIGGAKKDTWTGFKDKLAGVSDDDIASHKLSEIWPAPDYQKLIDDGMDARSVAMLRSIRDEVPSKPRTGYKLKRWAEQVKDGRALALDILSVKDKGDALYAELNRVGGKLSGIAGRADLYMAVGHEKSLEGIRLAHHHYSLYRGRENVNLWVVERDAAATAFSNFPQELAIGDTKQDAIDAFKARYAELDGLAAVKKASFDIYSQDGKFFIGKKIGRNIAEMAGPFATLKETRDYRVANLSALDAKLEKYKEIPKERRDTNEPRVGEDMRNGQDVTPEMFSATFGFKGVEFGNYVEQKRRQKDLNNAFDALMDMAAIMGVPAKAISLNGELGLAFGARGSGGVNPAAAHYESDKIVINLTKREGAGSLGHEWWHALDNYFSRMRGNKTSPFMTTATDVGLSSRGSQYMAYPGVRKEMIDAFGEVVKAIKLTAIKARSSKMDAKRTKEYWTTGEEMAARAFESYLISKLHDQNASNDYLANVVDQKTWGAMAALGMENDNSYPYPTAGEMPVIRAGFDKFFETLETKETDSGHVAMFSRSAEGKSGVLSRDGKFKAWPKFLNWTRAEHDDVVSLLPENYRDDSHRGEPLTPEDRDAHAAAALPELREIGRFGIDKLGNIHADMRGGDERNSLNDVRRAADIADKHGLGLYVTNVSTGNMAALQTDGFEAELGLGGVLQRATGSKDAPIPNTEGPFGHSHYGTIMSYKPKGFAQVLFARANFYYSALSKGVEGINAKAQSGQAWIQNILGLVKAGKVKADEVELSGITDFLKLQEGKVTKEQVTAYLDANGVQVTETVLEEGDWAVYDGEANQYFATRREAEDYAREMGINITEDTVFRGTDRKGGYGTKYSNYQTPGGENYREILLTLPSTQERGYAWEWFDPKTQQSKGGFATAEEAARVGPAGSSVQRVQVSEKNPDYKSSHWDQPNVLAHIRLNDRVDADGNKVLFVEEVQSDWGQDGKKKGFSEKPQMEQAFNASGQPIGSVNMAKSGVPTAPFVTNTDKWLSLALKRIIKLAVDEGYDKVAFVNGEQSAERYDLSKSVQQVIIKHYKAERGEYSLKAMGRDGSIIIDKNDVKSEDFDDYIGKDLAEKARKQIIDNGWANLQGMDLKVGGEGMKTFYDAIVPNATKALLKKLGGGQLEGVVVDNGGARYQLGGNDTQGWQIFKDGRNEEHFFDTRKEAEDYMRSKGSLTQPGFTITDAMRENASGGLPLFSKQSRATGLPINQVQSITDAIKSQWANAPEIVVVENMDDPAIPQAVRDENTSQLSKGATGAPEGFYYGGKVYVVASAMSKPGDVIRVLFHETLGHAGLRGVFGKALNDILNQIILVRRGEVAAKAKQYGLDMNNAADRLTAAEEVLAEMSQTKPELGFVKRAIAAIRTWLRQNVPGFADMKVSDAEIIQQFILPARAFIQSGKTGANPNAATVFSRGTNDAMTNKDVVGNQGGRSADDISPGAQDETNPDIRFSRQQTIDNWTGDFETPTDSKFDDVLYKLQDKHIDTKRVIQAITDAGKQIKDELDVYLQEELFHGRAAKHTQDFIHTELSPLLKDMRMRGVDVAGLDKYLHARHAEEANKLIAERNPENMEMQDGGSGMSTKDANAYLDGLDPALRHRLDALAVRVDTMIARTNQLYVDYNLESQKTVDSWGDMFAHYVPLMREDKEGRPGIGQGFSIKGRETKSRTGSHRAVVDILANIAMQRERAIVRGEKNRVATALMGLVVLNPNPEFWSYEKVPTQQVLDPETNTVVTRSDPMYKSRDNVMVAKVKNKAGDVREVAVIFNEDNERAVRMAAALKNLDASQLEGVLGVAAKITRYFSAVNTQYNPIFGVVNLTRDLQDAALNLTSTEINGKQAEVIKNTIPALRGIFSDARRVRDGKAPNSDWSKLWEEFQRNGGQTGYRDMFANSQDRAKAIEHELDPTKWMDSPLGKVFTAGGTLKAPLSVAQKMAGGLFGVLSDYNESMENAVRLSAYKVAIEQGMTPERAASLAKNMTVNFNRKGEVTQQAGALYAFFNASVQGTGRLSKTLFEIEGNDLKTVRLSKAGAAIVAGGVLLGVIQAVMLPALGFDDEDPPEFVRSKNLIIPIGDKKYVTIPLGLGFNILPNIGRISTEFVMGGFKDKTRHALKLLQLIPETFNPVGGGSSLLQILSPTALDPLTAIGENKDWTGKPIAKATFDKTAPGFTNTKDTASKPSKLIAEAINYMSGGSKYSAGVFSPTPDQIDYLFGQVTGGVGREISKTEQTTSAMISGEDLPTYKIPLVGRFYGNAGQSSGQSSIYYANMDKLNKHEAEIKGRQKDGHGAEIYGYIKENPESVLFEAANASEKRVRELRHQKSKLIKDDAPRERVKAMEERITLEMTRFNNVVKKLKKAPEPS